MKTFQQFNFNFRKFLIVALTITAFMFTQKAEASHFRGGTITWRVTNGTTVEFTVTSSWRSTFVATPFLTDPSPGTYTQISNVNVSTVNGVTTRVTKYIKTFNSNGPHRVTWGSCCRIGGLANGGGNWLLYTIVDFSNGNENSPVSSLPAIVNVPDGLSAATFSVPANDLDGDNLTYRLATASELIGTPPPGMSINSTTGQITINTTISSYNTNQLWFAGVIISDGQAEIFTDFLIQITNTSTPPVFNYGPTPPDGTVYQTSPGNAISFQVEAQDTDPGGTIALLFASGLPGGASFNQSSGNPALSSFSWNPTATDFGTYVLNFIAQDNIGVQSSTSVTIQVSLDPVFDVPPTPVEGVHNIIVSPGTTISYPVQASDPDPNDVVQIVNVQGKNMMTGNPIPLYTGATLSPFPTIAGNPTSGTFSWPTQASDWGHKHVFFTAQDSYGDETTHEVSQLINTVPSVSSTPVTDAFVGQTYTYNIIANDPDIPFGDTVDFVSSAPLPLWLSLTTDPITGTAILTGTPGNSDIGPVNISLLVEDLYHHHYPSVPSHDFTITVQQPIPQDPCAGALVYNWSGAVNSDWTEAGNYSGGVAPTLSLNKSFVIINDGSPNYPVLMNGQDLYIDACSTVEVRGSVTTGAVLTVNPNVVITNDGVLDVGDGSTLILESDATGSAYIGAGTGAFSGDFTVERYIPARRAYRLLSSPVTTGPIADNWQQGTHITGSTTGANGFDATATGNPSMYIYDNNTYAYSVIPDTDPTNLVAGMPYQLFVRGDRSVDISINNPPATNTTLIATGELTPEMSGSHTVSANVPSAGYVFVGNPFQAPVDMSKVLTTNATNIYSTYYWAWDPNLSTNGAYVAIEAATGVNFVGSAANQNLQAGQAAYVYALGAGNTEINFTQACKSLTPETAVFKTTAKKESRGELRLTLFESGALAANQTATDGILVLFDDNGNNAFDGFDAPKFTNIDENFATSNNGTLLGIESRATPKDTDKIQLEINTYRHSDYTMVLKGSYLQGATPYLYDVFTDVYTEIPQNGTVSYAYNVDANIPASMDADRFMVVFGSQQALSVSNLEIEHLKMYPNPSNTGQFYLNIPQQMDDLEVNIYNVLGAKLFYKTGFTAGQRISIKTDFARNNGIYFVYLTSKGITTTKKLIIN